ncbi:pentapeptide repeat-containing protein [Stenomitos frigidus]|uniref:Pentapeptide repeat-containing protein n=1 Tax=Stenomitos frigidus ULC18 TaxID=2107698 RepID=A0A2T1E029_9CYAN|nr:pentapeptide repeat-containing protein [Stenomitos frigidus]PSB26116.1 hypothetical protein C7B82_20725 [Stenomitos frigidus ULC18]
MRQVLKRDEKPTRPVDPAQPTLQQTVSLYEISTTLDVSARNQQHRRNSGRMLKALMQKPLLSTIGSVVVVLVLLGIWKIPQWQVAPLQKQIDALQASGKPADPEKIAPLEKSRLDAENTSRTVLVQGVGGLLVFATIFISWRNLRATQEKQVADRFSKAVEQLGSDNIHARLGGIYALEQIAKDAEEKYYWQVMETLTSYVRERSPWPPKATKTHSSFVQVALEAMANNETQSDEKIPPLAIDVQAVMTVLERRRHTYRHPLERRPLDLYKADLRQLKLPPKAQLNQANLAGTNLQGADLLMANLQGANLMMANLQGANLMMANLQGTKLTLANLQKALLHRANLQKAVLWGANLHEANLWEANLRETKFKNPPNHLTVFGVQEAVGLTWKQLNVVASYRRALLPDYLPPKPPQAETAQSATQATESVQAEGETE